MVSDLWVRESHIRNMLFDESTHTSEVELYYMDLMELHEFGDASNDFFDMLANTEKLELFDLEVVQRLIMFQWPIVKRQYLLWNFLPAVLFLTTLTCYTTFMMHDRIYGTDDDKWIMCMAVEEIMAVLAVVLLHSEYS